jgi:hypothetical protein
MAMRSLCGGDARASHLSGVPDGPETQFQPARQGFRLARVVCVLVVYVCVLVVYFEGHRAEPLTGLLQRALCVLVVYF